MYVNNDEECLYATEYSFDKCLASLVLMLPCSTITTLSVGKTFMNKNIVGQGNHQLPIGYCMGEVIVAVIKVKNWPLPKLSLQPPRKCEGPSRSWSHTESSSALSLSSCRLVSSKTRVWFQVGFSVLRHTLVFCFDAFPFSGSSSLKK